MFKTIFSNSPKEIVVKSVRKICSLFIHFFLRIFSRFFSTHISDQDFNLAVRENLRGKEKFINEIREDKKVRFFVSRDNKEFLKSELRSRFQASERKTVEKANEVCEHKFDLLGSGPTFLGNPINWHIDFISNTKYSSKRYYKDFMPAKYPGGHDIKVPWELSRCQHFVWLGQAYWFTSDERYAEEFVNQVDDWIEQNPPRLGVNWVTAMDVAIRAVNWLWGYFFFMDSPQLTDEFTVKFFKSLLYHGRHIMHNLETSGVTNNHYLSDLAGLIFLGILLPQFKESEKWLSLALSQLESEIRKQIRDDGVDFESSTSYHRLVTEILVSSAILAKLNGHLFSQVFFNRLEKMVEFLMHITKPDGTSPLLGDVDNGRLQRLKVWEEGGREWVDYRSLLAIGAVLFNRVDFAYVAGDQWQEAFWLLGDATASFLNENEPCFPVSLKSHAYHESGIFVTRTNGNYMVVSTGPIGQKKNGGHAHNDALSFELFANDQTWIIDPGTYVYTSKQDLRNLFRSTRYHSTVIVDGQEINRISNKTMFEIGEDAETCVENWLTSEEFDYLKASHNGYKRLSKSVIHQREYFFDKSVSLWLIRDTFTGKGDHKIECNWPIPPELTIEEQDKSLVIRNKCGELIKITLFVDEAIDISFHEGMISPGYGSLIRGATFIRFTQNAHLPVKYIFAFSPSYDGGESDATRIAHARETFNSLEKESR